MLILYDSLLLFVRGYHHCHSLALKDRHILGVAEFFKLYRKPEELLLALVLEHNGTSPEEDGRLYLGAFLEEFPGVLELELEIVLVGIRTEADFLDHHLGGVGFHLLRLLLALVEELFVIEYLTNWRIGLGADFHQIQLELVCQLQCFRNRVYARFRNIFPNQTHLLGSNLLVYVQLVLIALLRLTRVRSATGRLEARRLRFVR